MVNSDFSKMFSCPKCGTMGAIYVLKVSGDKIIVKQRCPKHGGRSFKVPLIQKDQFIHLIRSAVFRCYKCGQEAIVSYMKPSGPWALIKCSCPTHGKMTTQKIWKTIYTEISSKAVAAPEPTQPEPTQPEPTPSEEKKVCPICKTPIEEIGKFCGTCGAKLD